MNVLNINFEELAERARRLVCRVIGHDWREDGGDNSPVIPLSACCVRCGKHVRLIE